MNESFGILQTLKLNAAEITSCDFNGDYLLGIGSSDKTVRVLEWKAGLGFVDKYYSPLRSHKYGVTSVRFSPKGTMIVSSSTDGTAALFNVKTGIQFFTVVQPNKSSIRNCEFTPDSKKLVTGGNDGLFCFWDLVHRTQIRNCQLHDDVEFCIRGLSISPDSEYLMTADSGGLLKLWFIGAINTDQPHCLLSRKNIHDGVFSCEFSPKMNIIGSSELKYSYCIVTCGADSLITIWQVMIERSSIFQAAPNSFICNITTTHILKGHLNDVLSVRFNSNGTYLASTGLDNTVRLWQVHEGSCVETLNCHIRFATCSAFSKDSKLLATGSNDKTVIIWDLSHSLTLDVQLLKPCDVSSHFTNADFVNYLTKNLNINQVEKRKGRFNILQILNSSSTFNSVHFHSNDLLATAGGEKTVTIWKKQPGKNFYEKMEKIKDHKYSVNYLEISPCGTQVISCSMDGVIIFWNLNIGLTCEMRTPSCTSGLRICRFSPDSKFIAAAGDDQKVFLWNVSNLEFMKILQGHKDAVTSLAFTSDSKFLVSTCSSGDIKLYDFQNDQNSAIVSNAHDLGTTSCDFSFTTNLKNKSFETCESDNFGENYLLVTCGNDSLVKLWQVKRSNIQILKNLTGHGGAINYVRFSPKEPFILASCATDGTVRIWSAKSGQCLHILNLHQNAVTTCSFSQDSTMLATGSLDKSVLIWSFPEQICPEPLNVTQYYSKLLQNWTTSDIVQWFADIGWPEIAEKVKFTTIDGKKLLSKENHLLLDALGLESEAERQAIQLQLHWLKEESTRNFSDYQDMKNVPHKFLCPITHEIMKDPVICSDGYTYERGSIEEWFLNGKSTSPITNELLKATKLTANFSLRQNICKFLYESNVEQISMQNRQFL